MFGTRIKIKQKKSQHFLTQISNKYSLGLIFGILGIFISTCQIYSYDIIFYFRSIQFQRFLGILYVFVSYVSNLKREDDEDDESPKIFMRQANISKENLRCYADFHENSFELLLASW